MHYLEFLKFLINERTILNIWQNVELNIVTSKKLIPYNPKSAHAQNKKNIVNLIIVF